MGTQCVFYAKGTEFVNIIYRNSGFKALTRVWVQRQTANKTDAMQVGKLYKRIYLVHSKDLNSTFQITNITSKYEKCVHISHIAHSNPF
jgi:hypothetical protein